MNCLDLKTTWHPLVSKSGRFMIAEVRLWKLLWKIIIFFIQFKFWIIFFFNFCSISQKKYCAKLSNISIFNKNLCGMRPKEKFARELKLRVVAQAKKFQISTSNKNVTLSKNPRASAFYIRLQKLRLTRCIETS